MSFHTEKVASFEGRGSLYKIASNSSADVRLFKFAASMPAFGQNQRPVTLSWNGSLTPSSVVQWLTESKDSLEADFWTIEVWPGEDAGDEPIDGGRGEPLIFRFRRTHIFLDALLRELDGAAKNWRNATVTLRPEGDSSTAYVWGALMPRRWNEERHLFEGSGTGGRRDAEVGVRLDVAELMDGNAQWLIESLLAATGNKVRDFEGLIRSVRSTLRTG